MKNRRRFSLFYKIFSILVAVITLTSVGAFAYNIAVSPVAAPVTARVTEKFTDFYVLNSEGKAIGNPQNAAAGEAVKVMAGILNQEQEAVSYRIEVTINQVKANDAGPLVLAQGETHQEPITIQPAGVGDNQTIEFLLYKLGQDGVYNSVSILVNVK